jgi:hypothetical protein
MMEILIWSNKDIPKKKKELAVKAYQSLFLKGFLEDFWFDSSCVLLLKIEQLNNLLFETTQPSRVNVTSKEDMTLK